MSNPYKDLGDSKYWKTCVATKDIDSLPIEIGKTFPIGPDDRIVTAGSCFAQNVGKYLVKNYPDRLLTHGEVAAEMPLFSAAYGNIYTSRQMLELLREVFDGDGETLIAKREDGKFVDVLRPHMFEDGFDTEDEVRAAREAHKAAIKSVFEDGTVFVFTLGLTEVWLDDKTGRALPVCPNIYTGEDVYPCSFASLTMGEVVKDMEQVIAMVKKINPDIRVLLTVSPVPLTATFAATDVLQSTVKSKSILRAAVDELERGNEDVYYFPSFDMLFNPFVATDAFMENKRHVKPEMIENVMRYFDDAFISGESGELALKASNQNDDDDEELSDDIFCDEDEIDGSIGF